MTFKFKFLSFFFSLLSIFSPSPLPDRHPYDLHLLPVMSQATASLGRMYTVVTYL